MQTLSKLIVITCFVFKAQDKFKPVLFSSFCYSLSLNGDDEDERQWWWWRWLRKGWWWWMTVVLWWMTVVMMMKVVNDDVDDEIVDSGCDDEERRWWKFVSGGVDERFGFQGLLCCFRIWFSLGVLEAIMLGHRLMGWTYAGCIRIPYAW